jgi:kinetochore protein Spc25, fungi type
MQAVKNGPELTFWEEHLAMKLEGVREDVLRIVFTHIYESDWTQECLFIVDLSERDYRGFSISFPADADDVVVECKPTLEDLPSLVRQLNETRDFFQFLKWMRHAFKKHSLK